MKGVIIMPDKYMDAIKSRIQGYSLGHAFHVGDFTDLAEYDTVKQSLARLERSGKIRRVLRGIYDKPAYSELLQEQAAPEPLQIAAALARRCNWSIAPTGDAALNLLGLSTQVPASWSFVSSGPYKTYGVGNLRMEFQHRSNKQISGMSHKTALIVQAMKTIGRRNLNKAILSSFKQRLSDEDKKALLHEGRVAPHWIYTGIKEICKGVA